MGHFEEHGEVISANKQVAGREETSWTMNSGVFFEWENECDFELDSHLWAGLRNA